MNANKQDAGGLLPDELEAAIQDVADHANSDGDFVSNETERATENLRMKIRAYGELCRAAPAGGDEPDVLHPQYRHGFESGMKFEGEHGLMTTNAPKRDSAPAGSGEVEDENAANIESYAGVLERMALCNPRTADDFNLSQSARHIRDYAALLRKLQQGAGHG